MNSNKCSQTKENDLEASKVEIRKSADNGITLSNTIERKVDSINQALSIFKEGNQNRHVAATNMNERSSRSHAVLILTLNVNNKTSGENTYSQLYLCDLAGSENVKKTNVTGVHMLETSKINCSLHQLSNVISALNKKSTHIPYRNSKLTRLLEKSLGGNAYTCMLICASNE